MRFVPQAGAIAARVREGDPEFLVVTAKKASNEWIFPKGHIEPGETFEAAAVRELEEEAGVRGVPIGRVGESRFRSKGENVECTYFLIRASGDGRPREGRRALWLPFSRARAQLSFENARELLDRAAEMLRPEV